MSRRKEEPASLAAVKVRRAPRRSEGSGKAGDITGQLLPPNAPPSELPLPPTPREQPPVALLSPVPVPVPVTMTPVAPVSEFALIEAEPAALPPVPHSPPPAAVLPPAPAVMTPVAPVPEIAPIATQPASPAPAANDVPVAPAKPHEYWEFIDYWNRLRRDRPVPALTLLDRELVAECWPNSLMVTYAGLDASVPQVSRLSKSTGEIEYTPMVTEWIITCARQVARYGEAMEDEQEFPLTGGATGYRLLLLPFAGAQGESDHVLCHLSRTPKDGAARF